MLPERRGVIVGADVIKAADHNSDHGIRVVRRSRRSGRRRLLFWMFSFAAFFSICIAVFGFKMFFHGVEEHQSISSLTNVKDVSISSNTQEQPKKKPHRARFNPCEVELKESVDALVEPEAFWNFVKFSLDYVEREDVPSLENPVTPRFGGHQTLEEREKSFHAVNQTIHCGFVKGLERFPSTGFDLEMEDRMYMSTCTVAVSSCIFGSSDFLRRPTSKMISQYSKKNVCFIMFVDKETLVKLSKEGSIPDEKGFIGLWRIVVVSNLPYDDMRKTGKVPKFLSHRLFPSSRYSIWLDSKMRLHTDPMLLIDYFLWRTNSEYAISNHYTRHCVWDEVQQNKRLNKYNHTAIDEQFLFYQSDGLHKFDPSNPNNPLPSCAYHWFYSYQMFDRKLVQVMFTAQCPVSFSLSIKRYLPSDGWTDTRAPFPPMYIIADVPEGSFIVRAHTPMSNLFSCLWFNEVDRFTSRDQLSFGYTFLKLTRTNPDKRFVLHMFKDCERRSVTKLFHHRNP